MTIDEAKERLDKLKGQRERLEHRLEDKRKSFKNVLESLRCPQCRKAETRIFRLDNEILEMEAGDEKTRG